MKVSMRSPRVRLSHKYSFLSFMMIPPPVFIGMRCETIEKQGAMAVLLAEIQGKINQLGIEHGFNSDRFRPLTEAEQEEVEQAALELETTI